MKKLFMVSFIISMILSPLKIQAETNFESFISQTIEKSGEFTIKTTITEKETYEKSSQKTATKTVKYYNGNNLLWSVSVTGTFTYNGSSSSCISTTVSATSYNSNWKVSDKKAWKSNDRAYASAKGTRYSLGKPVQSITKTAILTCSAKGSLS